MPNYGSISAVVLCLLLAGIVPAPAATRTWVPTTGTNDWFNPANWDGGLSIPGAGDAVTIATAGAALLTNSPGVYFSSLTLSKTLIFSNWNTTLSATNITIQNGGTVTLPAAFTTNQMSNNVYFVCSNLTVDAGGSINVDGKGWAGGTTSTGGNGPGRGTGGGANAGGAGGYGGWGGASDGITWGLTYGSATNPLAPGSGGDNGTSYPGTPGRAGGGAIRIEATGLVTINGTITANGDTSVGYYTGAGSGGGIYITCSTVQGAGIVRVDGGNGALNGNGWIGGGGRIAVIYNTNLQTSVTPAPTIQFSSAPGSASGIKGGGVADLGTLCFPDMQIVSTILPHNGQLIIPGLTNWVVNNLTITNGWIRIPVDGFRLNVTGNLRIDGAQGKLELGGNQNAIHVGGNWHIWNATTGCTLTCGGNLLLTNNGSLVIYSGLTDATKTNSSLVKVDGALQISPGSWVYPVSHPTNGGSVKFRVGDLTITTNAGINANSAGFSAGWVNGANGYGPGGGVGYAGGYGGVGGALNVTYGSISAPVEPGSGGKAGTAYPGNAGGLVWIESSGNVVVNGVLSANASGSSGYGSAPGSGGGVYIICNTFAGTNVGNNGVISASGGFWGDNGGGGGGRIAIVYTNAAAQGALPKPSVVFSCARGTGNGGLLPGEIGTIYFPDTQILPEILPYTGQLIVKGWTNWAPNNLTISNGWLRLPDAGFRLAVSNDLTITGPGARLDMGGNRTPYIGWIRHIYTEPNGSTLTCGGNLLLTNNGSLYIYSGMAARSNYGASVAARDVYVNSNCWIYPVSHPTNGGSVLFQMRNLTIPATNAGFNANLAGYTCGYFTSADGGRGYGPGGSTAAGGSYGGRGGGNASYGAATYGSSNAPVEPGSGGKNGSYQHTGGNAGGLIRLDVTGILNLNGSLTAKGEDAPGFYRSGGAGGGIYVTCRRFTGSSGILSATGGTGGAEGGSGGGGGGRIAVWRITDQSSGTTATVAGGVASSPNYNGEVGTLVWGWIPPPGTVFTIH